MQQPTATSPLLSPSSSKGNFSRPPSSSSSQHQYQQLVRSPSANSILSSSTTTATRKKNPKRTPSPSSPSAAASNAQNQPLSILDKHKHVLLDQLSSAKEGLQKNISSSSPLSKNKRKQKVVDLWKSAEKKIVERSLYSSVARIPFALDRLSDFRIFFKDDLGMYDKELSENEFVDIFQEALAGRRFSRKELSQWFKDIDVDCGESVSWDEFSTFILTQTKIEQKLARDMDRARDFVPDITYPLTTVSHHRHLSDQLVTIGTPKFQGLPDQQQQQHHQNYNRNQSSSSPLLSTSKKTLGRSHVSANATYTTGLLSILSASSDGQVKFWSKPQHDVHEASGRPANEPHLVCGYDNFSTEVQGVNTTNSASSSAIMNLLLAKKQQQQQQQNSKGDAKASSSKSSSSSSLMKTKKKSSSSSSNNNNAGGMKYSHIVGIAIFGDGADGHFFVLGSDRTVNVFNARTHKIALRFKGYPTAASRFIRATLGSERGIFASEPRDGVPLVRMLDMNDFPSSVCVARAGHFASTAARDPSVTFQGDECFFFGMQSGDVLVYVTERHMIRALRNPVKIFGKELLDSSSSSSSTDPLLNTEHKIAYAPKIHTDRIHKIQYSSIFGGLITCSWDGTMRITDPESGKTNFSFDCVNHRFSPSFDYVPPTLNRKNSRFFHSGGVPVTTCGFGSGPSEDIDLVDLKHHNPISDFALNERDHIIATAAGEHQCLLWSPALAAHPIGVLRSPRSKIIAVCFASDQHLVITLDQVGGVVRIWDLRTNSQRQILHFKDHESVPPEARLEIPRRIEFEPRTGTLVAVKRSPCTWTIRRRIAASSIHNDAILATCLVDSASNGGWIFSCDSQEVAAFSIQKGTRKLMFVPFQHVDANAGVTRHNSKSKRNNNNSHQKHGTRTHRNHKNNDDDNDDDDDDDDRNRGGDEVENTIDQDQSQPIAGIGLDRHERRIYFCSKDGLCRVFNARTGMYLSQMRPRHYYNHNNKNTIDESHSHASVSSNQSGGGGDIVAVVPLTSADKCVRIIAIVASTEIHFVWDSFDSRLGSSVEFNKNKSHRVLKLREQIPPSQQQYHQTHQQPQQQDGVGFGGSENEFRFPRILHSVRGLDPEDRSFVPYLIVGLDDGRIIIVNAITTSVMNVLRGSDKTIFNSVKAREKFEREQKQQQQQQQQQVSSVGAGIEKTDNEEDSSNNNNNASSHFSDIIEDPHKNHPINQHHQQKQHKPKFIDLKGRKSAPEELIENHLAEKNSLQIQLNDNSTGEMRIEDMVLVRKKDLLVVVFENSPLIEMWNVRTYHHIVSRVTWPVNMIPRGIDCIFNTNENEKTEMLQRFSPLLSQKKAGSRSSFDSARASPMKDPVASENGSPSSSPTTSKTRKVNAKPPAPCFTAVTCDGRGEVMFCGDIHGCIYVFDITAINTAGSCPHWLRSGASFNALSSCNNNNNINNNIGDPVSAASSATSSLVKRSNLFDTSTKKKAFFSSIARRAGLAAKQERIHEMRKLAARKPKDVGPQTIGIRLLKIYRAHSDAILKLSYSDSSQRLISQGADLVVKCFTGIGKEIGFFGPPEPFHSANLSDLYKDSEFRDRQRMEERKRKKEFAESLMAKSQKIQEELELQRIADKKRKRKFMKAEKRKQRSRSPTPNNNNTHNNTNAMAERVDSPTSVLSFDNHEDEIVDGTSYSSSSDDDDDDDSSDDENRDFTSGQNLLRGCSRADPLIQSALLTQEELDDCPEIVMIERIAPVIPKDPFEHLRLKPINNEHDHFFERSAIMKNNNTTTKTPAIVLPLGEEYYTVQNFNADKVHGSLEYTQFLVKITSNEFVSDRLERSQNFNPSSSSHFGADQQHRQLNNRSGTFSIDQKRQSSTSFGSGGGGLLARLKNLGSTGDVNVNTKIETEHQPQIRTKTEKGEVEEADFFPAMSLVKASTLMLRSMKSRNGGDGQHSNSFFSVALPPLVASSPGFIRDTNEKRDPSNEIDGFFLTSPSPSAAAFAMTPPPQQQQQKQNNKTVLSTIAMRSPVFPQQNAPLPPIFASATRLRDPLKRSSHKHVNHLIEACEKRQAENEKQILIGLKKKRAATPNPSSSSTASLFTPVRSNFAVAHYEFGSSGGEDVESLASYQKLSYTALQKRHEKQQGHLEDLPVPLRTPDGIHKMVAANKRRRDEGTQQQVQQQQNGIDIQNGASLQQSANEDSRSSALRIPIETLDYLSEKPRRIKLKSLGMSMKL